VQDQVVSFTAFDGTAVEGTDYSYVKGFIIPAGDYTAPQTLTKNNFMILGDQLCQPDRTFNISIDSDVCNSLIGLGSITYATFTIIDDDPIATMNQPANQTHCAGASVPATTFSGSFPDITYSWTATNGTNIGLSSNSGTGNLPAFTATNTGNTAIVATITVTPVQTGSSCDGSSEAKTFTITVNANPSLSVSASPTEMCSGQSATFTATASGATTTAMTYTWLVGGTSQTTTSNTYSRTLTTTSSYSASVRNSNNCTSASTAPQTITVIPVATPSIAISTLATKVCSGTVVEYTSSITDGGATPQYRWQADGVDIPGATASTLIYSPAHNEAITCILESTAQCAVLTQVVSNEIRITVTQTVIPTVRISAVSD
jgi:hypothetical protein